jgi:hypothetical protein
MCRGAFLIGSAGSLVSWLIARPWLGRSHCMAQRHPMEADTMRRLTLLPLATLALLLAAAPVAADSTYRTERLRLRPADSGEQGYGMVVNAHPNGPRIYAHEQYLLTGAKPRETYEVWLLVGADCDSLQRFVQTASITTNGAGNGAGDVFFSFEAIDALGVRGTTLAGAWEVVNDGLVAYETDCTSIELD